MAFVAVYDANVLYPSTLRDVLIRVAPAGIVQAKWTDQILDETFRNLKKNRPDLDPGKLDRTRERMSGAVRDVLVKGYEPLIEVVDLPDPDDRHVLATAIRAKAQVIVTSNLRHFPADNLSTLGCTGRPSRRVHRGTSRPVSPAGPRSAHTDSGRVEETAARSSRRRDRFLGA
ncbi:PIN domain-containing protein [Streptomyces sp. NPDC051018]|uniref:PIN domain-containing protein n=1 Tax=Streptomyces sp. NPDC051018 TaxID=3365639 RepID=UPI0037B741E3